MKQAKSARPIGRIRRRSLIGIVVAGTALFAACGGDDSSSAPDATAADTTAVEGDSLRIVSLSPTHTEILYAIGAGDEVVAVDSMSNFPAEAAITAKGGSVTIIPLPFAVRPPAKGNQFTNR